MKIPEPRQLKSGTWFIQMRLSGESISVSASSKTECKRNAELIKAQHRSGVSAKRLGSDNLTLREAAVKYIESRKNILSPATVRDYNSIVKNRFQGVMDKPVSKIKNWQKVCNEEAASKSAKTIATAYSFVCSVLTFHGFDPQKVTLPQIVPHERPWLSPDQIPLFVRAVHGERCEIPALMALHSLRKSEIMAVTWENVDIPNGVIYVKGAVVPDENHKYVLKQTNKNTTSNRTVPIMIPELLEALASEPEKSGFVVKSWPDTVWRQINCVCDKNKFPRVGIHGLRHSFASLAYHIGMPQKEAMEIDGWADSQTMNKIYTHIAQADRIKSINKMSEFYSNANKNANNIEETL